SLFRINSTLLKFKHFPYTTLFRSPKRNPERAVEALILAGYKCEYNPTDRTFTRKNGKQYTEPHHLIPISNYQDFDRSLDVKENIDRKSTRLNSSHVSISYAVFCLK